MFTFVCWVIGVSQALLAGVQVSLAYQEAVIASLSRGEPHEQQAAHDAAYDCLLAVVRCSCCVISDVFF